MMKINLKENRISENPRLWLSVFGIWLFYLWIICITPYEIDDWSWGISEGWKALLTGELNGRYLSNLLEVVVTRSSLLKTLLIGTLAALLPLLSTLLCVHFSGSERTGENSSDWNGIVLRMFLLAVLLFLTLPIPIWRQTYGWIAGFSNFGFSGIVLLAYQGILIKALWSCGPNPKARLAGVLVFGIGMQLVLENVTIYILAVTAFIVLEEAVRKRQANPLLISLLLGNLIGALIMFCGSIYGTLMETGHAINGMRAFKVDRSIGLLGNLLLSQQRFVYFFPQSIWSNNWVLCVTVSLMLADQCLKKKNPVRIAAAVAFFLFAALFCFIRFIGPLELFVSGWSDVLTQRLNLLFFWFVACSVILLWWNSKRKMAVLLFLWFSAPGVILPLTVTNMNAEATRCFLTPAVFQIEFCLLLSLDSWVMNHERDRNMVAALLAIGILSCCTQRLVTYHDIASINQERAELIKSAQKGETKMIDFPDYQHWEYLWVTEPLGESQRAYFRAFYRIPDDVRMHFNTGEEDE
jgi:hypothetical protein